MKSRYSTRFLSSGLFAGLLTMFGTSLSTPVKAAQIADDFSLPYRGQPGNLNLYDFEGQVIFIEFFEAT